MIIAVSQHGEGNGNAPFVTHFLVQLQGSLDIGLLSDIITQGMGKIGQPIRVAVTGGPVSPPIDVTLWLVGQARTISRLDHAITLVEARAAAS